MNIIEEKKQRKPELTIKKIAERGIKNNALMVPCRTILVEVVSDKEILIRVISYGDEDVHSVTINNRDGELYVLTNLNLFFPVKNCADGT